MPEYQITGGTTVLDADDEYILREGKWRLDRQGYVRRNIWPERGKSRTLLLHRRVMGLSDDDPNEVDHLNRRRNDNRKANLAIVDHATQMQNTGGSVYRIGTGSLTGKWRVGVTYKGKKKNLSVWDTELEARAVSNCVRRALGLHGSDYPDHPRNNRLAAGSRERIEAAMDRGDSESVATYEEIVQLNAVIKMLGGNPNGL